MDDDGTEAAPADEPTTTGLTKPSDASLTPSATVPPTMLPLTSSDVGGGGDPFTAAADAAAGAALDDPLSVAENSEAGGSAPPWLDMYSGESKRKHANKHRLDSEGHTKQNGPWTEVLISEDVAPLDCSSIVWLLRYAALYL